MGFGRSVNKSRRRGPPPASGADVGDPVALALPRSSNCLPPSLTVSGLTKAYQCASLIGMRQPLLLLPGNQQELFRLEGTEGHDRDHRRKYVCLLLTWRTDHDKHTFCRVNRLQTPCQQEIGHLSSHPRRHVTIHVRGTGPSGPSPKSETGCDLVPVIHSNFTYYYAKFEKTAMFLPMEFLC